MPENKAKNKLSSKGLIESSEQFKRLASSLVPASKTSLTGITNLVVNYEDPELVHQFLNFCFEDSDLYHETVDIDAVELQNGKPGEGFAYAWLDKLIYGSYKTQKSKDFNGVETIVKNPQTGHRQRLPDGFINRRELLDPSCINKTLIINNIDHCLDFCPYTTGTIDSKGLWIFDHFRDPMIKKRCRMILVSNVPLIFPFKTRVIQFESVDEHESGHLLDNFISLYEKHGHKIELTQIHREQIIRKLCGLTYTRAGDTLAEALEKSGTNPEISRDVDAHKIVKNLRFSINKSFMQDGFGLTSLMPKPWGDYILPKTSHFTYDVGKILRDFDEIAALKGKLNSSHRLNSSDSISRDVEAIQTRMPHVIVLYGRGGLGKSAFPIHFAGLLEYDVWDLNIMASHSKWVGEGPERMRESLDKILKSSHVVLRVDEYDRAMGSTQASGHGMHEAHKQVEAEFMNWLQNTQDDNLLVQKNIFLVLTTNHKENITGPLLRSGRADLVIEIDSFDAESMKQTFVSAPRRMTNRGIHVPNIKSADEFLKKIEQLDIERLSEIATTKGFTVRDIDVLLIEMASHNYYYQKDNTKGIPWNTESFVKVLERSEGSAKDEGTNELVLGDRYYHENNEEKPQYDVVETIVVDPETDEKKRKLDLKKVKEYEKKLAKDQFSRAP